MSSALTDADLKRLGLSREQADWIGELVDSHGPFTTAERNRLAVLLRPESDLPQPRQT